MSGSTDPETRQLAAIEAQWCSHAAQAHQQATDAIDASHPMIDDRPGADQSSPDAEASRERNFKARKALPTEKAKNQLAARLVREWHAALLKRGDLHARATAHYLGATSVHFYSERQQEGRQLRQLAQQHADPYLARLWRKLGEGCYREQDHCKGPPPDHWSKIEPANALAWLPEWQDKSPLSEQQWQGLAQARYARAPGHKLEALLLELVAPLPAGMALDIALAGLTTSPESGIWINMPFTFTAAARRPLRHSAQSVCMWRISIGITRTRHYPSVAFN